MRSAGALPPAWMKPPPTYRRPGASALSAATVPFSDGVPGEPPVPTWVQPPDAAADAPRAARATTAIGMATTRSRRRTPSRRLMGRDADADACGSDGNVAPSLVEPGAPRGPGP